MTREMTVTVKIELSADRPTGIDASAAEALSHLNCNLVFDSREYGLIAAKMVSKSVTRYDEEQLLDLILETTGVATDHFFESKSRAAILARSLFAYYARKYLEWDWGETGQFIGRSEHCVGRSVGRLISQTQDKKRTNRIIQDMSRIQEMWKVAKG